MGIDRMTMLLTDTANIKEVRRGTGGAHPPTWLPGCWGGGGLWGGPTHPPGCLAAGEGSGCGGGPPTHMAALLLGRGQFFLSLSSLCSVQCSACVLGCLELMLCAVQCMCVWVS